MICRYAKMCLLLCSIASIDRIAMQIWYVRVYCLGLQSPRKLTPTCLHHQEIDDKAMQYCLSLTFTHHICIVQDMHIPYRTNHAQNLNTPGLQTIHSGNEADEIDDILSSKHVSFDHDAKSSIFKIHFKIVMRRTAFEST
eukprot:822553_1